MSNSFFNWGRKPKLEKIEIEKKVEFDFVVSGDHSAIIEELE